MTPVNRGRPGLLTGTTGRPGLGLLLGISFALLPYLIIFANGCSPYGPQCAVKEQTSAGPLCFDHLFNNHEIELIAAFYPYWHERGLERFGCPLNLNASRHSRYYPDGLLSGEVRGRDVYISWAVSNDSWLLDTISHEWFHILLKDCYGGYDAEHKRTEDWQEVRKWGKAFYRWQAN